MKQHSKFLLLLLGVGLCVAPILRAEDAKHAVPSEPPRHEKMQNRMHQMRQHMIKEVGLTAEQQAKWTEIDQQQKAAMDKLRGDPSFKPGDGKEQMKQFDAQRRAVLTPAQQQKFDEIRARQRDRMQDRRQDRQDGPSPHEGK